MADSDLSKEAWQDPNKNVVAANKKMDQGSVSPVILVGTDGEPYTAGSGGGGGTSGSVDVDNLRGPSSTVSVVASSVPSVQLLAANTSRIEAIIYNDSPTDTLYVKYGTSASASSFTMKLEPDDAVSVDTYTGIIHGAWSAANGDAKVTEVT